MAQVSIKATPVNGLYDFVRKELSPEQLQGVVDRLAEPQRRFFTGHILAHEVVPLEAANRFTELAAEAKGEPLKAFARRAGRYGAEIGLRTVYKFVLMVLSVESVLKKAPLMWTRVYDGGVVSVESTETSAKFKLQEFPGAIAVCGRITGWLEVIGEKTGARELHVLHESCVAEGGKECVWTFQWKK